MLMSDDVLVWLPSPPLGGDRFHCYDGGCAIEIYYCSATFFNGIKILDDREVEERAGAIPPARVHCFTSENGLHYKTADLWRFAIIICFS